LVSDISRQLASYLDQSALYGGGSAANQPQGLLNMSGVAQGVAIDPANLHPSFCAVEALVEAANVSMDSYGVFVGSRRRTVNRRGHPGIEQSDQNLCDFARRRWRQVSGCVRRHCAGRRGSIRFLLDDWFNG